MRGRVLERRLQSRVADQERRLGILAQRHVLGFGQEHLRQHHRGGALGGDGDRPHVLERCPRDELDRVDRALGAHAQAWQDPQPLGVARVLDRRDRRQVAFPCEEGAIQFRRHADKLLDLGVEPVEDRRHVHVADAA